MKMTGKKVSRSRLDQIMAIFKRTQMPLFGVNDATAFNAFRLVDIAKEELHAAIDQAAVELGLPMPLVNEDGDVVHYGMMGDGEISSQERDK